MPLTKPNSGLGSSGQTVQDVTASRAVSTVYTNSTGKPINVIIRAQGNAGSDGSIVLNGIVKKLIGPSSGTTQENINFIVPVNATYEFRQVTATITIIHWLELR